MMRDRRGRDRIERREREAACRICYAMEPSRRGKGVGGMGGQVERGAERNRYRQVERQIN